MSWRPEVQNWRESDRHDLVAEFYEELIETEPEAIEHYWYLGLAYLLAGREEEARATWLFVLGQLEETEIDVRTAELVAILDEEANRQAALEKGETSALIRDYIRELNPDFLANQLQLICLEIQQNRFSPEILQERSIIELIDDSSSEGIPLELWLDCIDKIIQYPSSETLLFVKRIFSKYFTEEMVDCVASRVHALSQKNIEFAIELLKNILEIYPNHLFYLRQISLYLLKTKEYRSSIEFALKMRENYRDFPESMKAYIESHILYTRMFSSNWEKIDSIASQYKQALRATIEAGQCPRFVRDATNSSNFPLVYLEDNLVETRFLFNRTGELFQDWTRKKFSRLSKPRLSLAPRQEKLKIGYIAHTLNNHTIGLITRWLIHYHDREKFQIALYLVNQTEDEITRIWFREKVGNCQNFPDDASVIAERIEADNLDILVDLDSITGHTTCQVMALKPAPVQVTWLGFDGSGIPAIDYLLVDHYVLPENAGQYYREKLWRLPDCYIAVDGVEVAYPTLRREDLHLPDDAIAYLSVQTGLKRHPEQMRLQIRILREVSNSYLLVQGLGDIRSMRELFTDIASEEGVNPDRLRFLPSYPTGIYRANLPVADVVLDTYPFTGGTTTLDVLWMGIPVVTKVGQQWASRNSYTLMINAGITEGIAWNDAEYIEWGIRFGTDEKLRRTVIAKLEASRRTSPIWNARRFTRNVEDAYRQMWANYLEK
ncbi:O-linked N-acetylglucosamine transferase, SPINDLY family protein [Pannus brasiliensis CCIBt3594]|uniref:O-linked N-acetylglucosamine transferase, SPINDLY family protein n=1 Tax=Pannus brasiliensis CCIBt3594 TaxID=1427578 RepID=A0AAW9QQ64_9CHRO